MRGATFIIVACFLYSIISTHTPHAGRDHQNGKIKTMSGISTHTPHAGRDAYDMTCYIADADFYSHAPCGARQIMSGYIAFGVTISTHTPHAGRDVMKWESLKRILLFLLTRPMRGAT